MRNTDTLVSRFERQAERTPAAVALVAADNSWTYADLARWAGSVHALLSRAGVRPGDLVGISLARSASVVPAVLGVLGAGCAHVPLDPSYPPDRLNFMASDARVSAVLAADPGVGLTGMPIVEMPGPRAGMAPERPARTEPAAPAYVIYTSGSTGTPKGVAVTHANVLALLDAAARHFTFGPADTWTFFHSYSFDFSVWEMWGALLTGGTLTCVPDTLRLHPHGFVRFLAEQRVTVLNIVPAVFRHLLAGLDGPQDELRLRQVIFGGEAVDAASMRRWLSAHPPDRRPDLVNMYGITETTVHVTYRRIVEADLTRTGSGTLIGTALPHLTMRLLDEDLRDVPPGQTGEIFVAGTGVSAGYLNRPRLTEQRFPLLPGPDGRPVRHFRTGDVAAWEPNLGSFIYHGRVDDQVQLRGFRVELGEVDNVLRGCPGVSDAAAVVEADHRGVDALHAYVVPAADEPDLADRIRKHAAAFLPRYMVPERIHVIARMPRTASGKTDRKRLPAAPRSDR